MILLNDLVAFLDEHLAIATIPDYPGALNGLQLANEGKVGRIIAAVDASLGVVESAAAVVPLKVFTFKKKRFFQRGFKSTKNHTRGVKFLFVM